MSRRTEVQGRVDGPPPIDDGGGSVPSVLPNLRGDLGGLLSTAPCFRVRVRGYDRMEVDNYVAWAESELEAARREADHLLARFGVCSAELEISRRLLAQSPRGRDLSPVSDRVRDILALAADEATAILDSAGEEADHILAEARVEADARLRKARRIKEMAISSADEMREVAREERAQAAAALERAGAEAEELVRDAAAQRDRLTREVAEARARLTEVQAELRDLRRERDETRQLLHRLTDQIGQALTAVTGGLNDKFLLIGNTVESVAP